MKLTGHLTLHTHLCFTKCRRHGMESVWKPLFTSGLVAANAAAAAAAAIDD